MENRLGRRHPLVQFVVDNWFYILLALVIWRLPYYLGDYFEADLRPRRPAGNQALFWLSIFIDLYIVAILAMSYNLVFGFGGLLSFGHALFYGTGVYVVVMMLQLFSTTLVVASGVALGISVIFGLLVGLVAFRLKGPYFAVFTLAMAQFFHELARVNLFKYLTQGDDGLSLRVTPDWINPFQNRLFFYYFTAFFMCLTFILIRRLMNSPTGRVILAIRDNEERAQTMGYNTALYKTLVIVMAGALATVAGILKGLFNLQAQPAALGLTHTVDPLLMTIIGGVGTHPGPLIGAVIFQLGDAFFRKPDLQVDWNFILFRIEGEVNSTEIWRVVLGVVFIVIVMAVPNGIVGQLISLWANLRRWLRRYFYDPLIRANPALAERMTPFTGEAPSVALAFAESSRDASLTAWLRRYPVEAALGVAALITVAGGLLTWDEEVAFSLALFFALFLVPIRAGLWLQKNGGRLSSLIPGRR